MSSVLSVEFTRNLCLMLSVKESLVTSVKVKSKTLALHSLCAGPLPVKGG
jgi:hypothetical protein